MKFSRNKTGLVVAAMILALTLILSGCTAPADNAGNKTPDFLEVGGFYRTEGGGGGGRFDRDFKVVEIRHDGWILVDLLTYREVSGEWWRVVTGEFKWVNTAQLVTIVEIQERPQ